MKADYIHKDTLTATDYVELNKNNKLLMSYNQALLKENKELKDDISFCLKSIKQEMEMSTDSRTRSEMTSCYEILGKWNK